MCAAYLGISGFLEVIGSSLLRLPNTVYGVFVPAKLEQLESPYDNACGSKIMSPPFLLRGPSDAQILLCV